MAELCAAVDATLRGQGHLLLLAGEPGIGKTRLAQEASHYAAQQGFAVFWGRCWEDAGVPAFWPWTQILRPLLHGNSPVPEQSLVKHPLALIVSGLLRAPEAESAALPRLDAPAARFALFEAVLEVLRHRAVAVPLLLVLDDLHAADEASLQLLRFVARSLPAAPLLLLATYREHEAQRSPQRGDLIGAMARSGKRLALAGLSQDGVRRLLQAYLPTHPSTDLVAAVHQATEGNPFFVDEVARLLAGQASQDEQKPLLPAAQRIPHGVRAAIRERLASLPPSCRELLRVAAAIGREFDMALLPTASRLGAAEVAHGLEAGVACGALMAISDSVGRYRFVHGLIRDVLHEEIAPASRALVHQHIADAMLALGHGYVDAQVDELARHFLEAAPAGCAKQAVAFAKRAAESASARMAYEDAAVQYERALQALAYDQPLDAAMQCELLLGLGTVRRAAADPEGRNSFEAARAVARAHIATQAPCFAPLLARAALGFADQALGMPITLPDTRTVELLEEALACLSSDDSDLRAKLLGRLSMETTAAYDRERSNSLSCAAVEMARRVGQPTTLATTLSYRHFVLWRLDVLADRLGLTNEIIQLAERGGHQELAVQGRSWRVVDLICLGDGERFDEALAVQAQAAEALRQPRYIWMTWNLRALRALWRGAWSDAESFAQQALAIGQTTGDPTPMNNMAAQMFLIRREQDRLPELESVHRFYAETYADNPSPHATLALLYADLGRRDEARREFDAVAEDGFARLSREHRVGILPFLAEACCYLGDQESAAQLYPLLLPYAEINLPYGAAACFGAGAYPLALLANTMGDAVAAQGHFATAIALNRRMQVRPWLARSLFAYARFLHSAQGKRWNHGTSAAALLDEAAAMADEMHMRLLTREIGAFQEGVPAADTNVAEERPAQGAGRGVGQELSKGAAQFVRRGDFWCVGGASGSALHLKDCKGARYLAHLLRHPAREFHATDLALLDVPEDVAEQLASRNNDSPPVLDLRAREAYRRRLEALREQHQEASGFQDYERASRLQEEIDVLSHELARAMGLHGRDRVAGSFAERSRLNVTRAIKSVIRRVAAADANLGRYLETTVRTGAFCSYTPDSRLPMQWVL